MRIQNRILLGLLFSFCVSLVGLAGCGEGRLSPDDIRAKANKSNMHRLINLYVRHQLSNQGKGPASENEFKSFISDMGASSLAKIGLDETSIDGLFLREQDSEAYEIRYGVYGSSRGSNEAIVFERSEINGVRRVGFTSRKILEVETDQEYDDLLAGKTVSGDNTASTNPAIPR